MSRKSTAYIRSIQMYEVIHGLHEYIADIVADADPVKSFNRLIRT